MEIGNIVDIHGKDVGPAIEEFNSKGIDIVLVNGDIQGYNDGDDFARIIEQIGKNLNGTALVIPGSHESISQYNQIKALEKEFNNIVDMQREKVKRINSHTTVVSYGGATWSPVEDPFVIDPLLDVSDLSVQLHKNKATDVILQMHEPPQGYGDIAEFVENGNGRVPLAAYKNSPEFDKKKKLAVRQNVGSEDLRMLIEGELVDKKPVLATFGHIHESYRFQNPGVEIGSKKDVPEGKKVDYLALNPGPYLEGRFAILDVGDGKALYKIVNVNE
jgi:Icc-related predicted phosphoesterase